MLLKKGMIVKLSEDSTWYNPDADKYSDNPTCLGFINAVFPHNSHCYSVKWDNGTDNVYMANELELS